MGLSETFNYVFLDNPISQSVKNIAKATVNPFLKSNEVQIPQVTVITEHIPLYQQVAEHGPFIKLAGVIGASAVVLGAYGAHKKYPKDRVNELKPVYETGNKFHFFHTLALLGVPFCRNPKVTGSLFIIGTILFSGACYYRAFTGKDTFGKLAPVGGTILILAWISMAV